VCGWVGVYIYMYFTAATRKYNVATKIKLSAWCVGNCLVVRCKENAHNNKAREMEIYKANREGKSEGKSRGDFGQTQKRQNAQQREENSKARAGKTLLSCSILSLSLSCSPLAFQEIPGENACAVSSRCFSCCFWPAQTLISVAIFCFTFCLLDFYASCCFLFLLIFYFFLATCAWALRSWLRLKIHAAQTKLCIRPLAHRPPPERKQKAESFGRQQQQQQQRARANFHANGSSAVQQK